MVEAGCDCVVMEVSSQGLMLHRTAGIPFEIGIFTNLGVIISVRMNTRISMIINGARDFCSNSAVSVLQMWMTSISAMYFRGQRARLKHSDSQRKRISELRM